MENSPNVADWIVAASAAATALLTLLLVIAAFVAWKTALDTLKASKDASDQARRDSIEQTRPYVYARLAPSLAGVGNLDLVVSNSGKSAAHGLTMAFDSWPEVPDDIAESLQTMFATPRTLPPRTSLRVIWRLEAGEGGTFDEGHPKIAGIHEDGVISLRYSSADPTHPLYEERHEAMFKNSGLWPVPEDGIEPPKRWGAGSDLKVFYELGRTLVRRVGELDR